MFEKYTEKARRLIFFARYECSADGSPTIESPHLLIGLMRESSGLLALYLDSLASQGEIRAEIAKLTTIQEPRPPIPRVSTFRSARSASTFLPSARKRPSASVTYTSAPNTFY
jgi:hypothetical protein